MARRPPPSSGTVVEPVAASTVVLVRETSDGIEVLLTERPATMSFAAGMMVFPGGRVDPADGSSGLAAHFAAIRELFEEAGVLLAEPGSARRSEAELDSARSGLLDGSLILADAADRLGVRLDTAALVPIARWVTPAAYARRFDARFFAARVPDGATVTVRAGEVASHRWLRPAEALEAMADGRIGMWIPTSATLQRLSRVASFEELRTMLAIGPDRPHEVRRASAGRIEVVGWSAGGAPGTPVTMTVVGRSDLTVVDPGDPSPEALATILAAAAELGGSIVAIVLSTADPERAAGADELAERTGAQVFAPIGARRVLPFAVEELEPGAPIPLGDAGLAMPTVG
jgi:8-oxo-dGTP pyrophosphatase MutT (NUDIX family)